MAAGKEAESRRGGKSTAREYAEAILIALVLALFVRTFVVQAFKIPSGSMEETLLVGDHILVNKFIYWLRGVERGDVIVFRYPQDESRDFIKRVVGLPGDE
ncbi:MAG: signal peptidase I, partial [bacterium]